MGEGTKSFLLGLLAAAVPLVTVLVTMYLSIRKSKREDEEHTARIRAEQNDKTVAQRREDNRIAAEEYKELFEEFKEELAKCRKDHQRAERQVARLEATLIANGIKLLPLDDTGNHTPLPADRGGQVK